MLRETTFWVGGAVTIALGAALAAGLAWAGAGLEFLDAWLAVPFAGVIGAFFLHVAREEGRSRRAFLRETEAGRTVPPGPGPP